MSYLLPAAPLREYLRAEMRRRDCSIVTLAKVLGVHSRNMTEWLSPKTERLHYTRVDRVCCILGTHPAEIYGALWDEVVPPPEHHRKRTPDDTED